ncbi:MAG: FtsX-like permease family protein [Bacillota bacterium]
MIGILIKYTFRNIKEHKFRTFLIILSIMLSVGLFFASFSISDVLTNVIMGNIKSQIGTAEINIQAGRFSSNSMIKKKDLGKYSDQVKYSVGVVEKYVKFYTKDGKEMDVNLKGFKLNDLEKINPINFIDFIGKEKFNGKKVIISQDFANENNKKIGDYIKLQFSEDIKPFVVAGISKNEGYFKKNPYSNGKSTKMIVPRETLSRFNGAPNMVNVIYVKSVNDKNIEQTINNLKKVYNKEKVEKMITKSEIDAQIKPIRIPFMFMLILVIIISIFIIYTSFKVIALERLPVLATFRSVGATKKLTDFILLIEAFIYAILGSIFGILIGKKLLSIVSNMIVSDVQNVSINYPIINILFAFVFGIVLSIISSLIPIVKISKTSIKDVLLDTYRKASKNISIIRYIIGIISIILSIILPKVFSEGKMASLSGGLGIIFMIIGVICFIPWLTDKFINIFEKLFGKIFGNIGLLSVKNMRGNKSTYDNIILLTIGIASVLTIMVISTSMKDYTMKYFNLLNYDIEVNVSNASKVTGQRILSIPGIKENIFYQGTSSRFKYNDKEFLRYITGINSKKYIEYYNYDILNEENDKKLIEKLLTGRKLIVGKTAKEKHNLTKGQIINLKTSAGMREYEIIGFIDTNQSNGLYGITSMYNLKHDLKVSWGLNMAIKVSDGYNIENIKKEINKKLSNYRWSRVQTLDEKRKNMTQESQKIVLILSAFSLATSLIGSIGVMNNFLVSFLARKKSLAIFTSVGMNKKQQKKMLLLESISVGIVASIFGLITSQLILLKVNTLLEKINLSFNLNLTLLISIYGIVGSILICTVASLGVLTRLGKVSVIEELRYE